MPHSYPLGNKPVPLELVGDPPDLGVDGLDPCNVGLGPSSVLPVSVNNPLFTFRGPWAGRLPTMQLAPVPPFNGGVLAGCPLAGLGATALARPVGTKTRCLTYSRKLLVVNCFHI